MATVKSNLAILIDGDNVSYNLIGGLMAEISSYGNASVRRVYGDWTSLPMKSWRDCLLRYSMTPMQQFAHTGAKNSTDGAMIIDAMDLLYTGRFTGFCIVSSSTDFTRLASRIREQGISVYGFGDRKINYAFIAAFDKFIYFDALKVESDETPGAPQSPQPNVRPPIFIGTQAVPRPLDRAAVSLLTIAVNNAPKTHQRWVSLPDLETYLCRISPDLNACNYGYKNFRDLISSPGILAFWRVSSDPPIDLVGIK